MRKSIVTVLAAVSFVGMIASPAAAESVLDDAQTVTVTVTVPYGDLDLAAPEGAAALDKRIEAAAGTACQKPDIRDLKAMAAWEECKVTAKAGALEQLSILEPYQSFALASVF